MAGYSWMSKILKIILAVSTIHLIISGSGFLRLVGIKYPATDQAAAFICLQVLLAVALIFSRRISGLKQDRGITGEQIIKTSRKKYLHALAFLFLLGLCLVTYSAALHGGFLFDDYVYMNYPASLYPSIGKFAFKGKLIRPMAALFWSMDRRLWDTDPFGFHLTNLILHAGCAILVYSICFYILKKRWPALFAGALFAVHPVQVEAAYWISARFDLICTLFCLASIMAYLVGRQGGRKPWIYLSVLAALLALLSKEMALTLPLIFIAIELLVPLSPHAHSISRPAFREAARRLVPHIALVSVYIGLRILIYEYSIGYSSLEQLKDTMSGLTLFQCLFEQLPLGLFMPINQDAAAWFPSFQNAVTVGLAVVFCYIGFSARAYFRPILYGLVWIAVTMIPVLSIYGLENTLQTSRYLYLPISGFSIFMAAILAGPFTIRNWRAMNFLIAFAIIALCIPGTRFNLNPWKESSNLALKIRSDILSSVSSEKGPQKIYVKGIPWDIHGVVVFGDALNLALRMTLRDRKADGMLTALGPISASLTRSAGTRRVPEHIYIEPNTEDLGTFDRIFYWDQAHRRLFDLTTEINASLRRRAGNKFHHMEFSIKDLIPVKDISIAPSGLGVARGHDPQIHTTRFKIDPAGYAAAELVMRVSPVYQDDIPRYGEIFWRHKGSTRFDDKQRLNFHLVPDSMPHKYIVVLKNEVLWLWKGPVVQIRLDPGDAPARFDILSLRLIAVPEINSTE
jgi:hypothetical protein